MSRFVLRRPCVHYDIVKSAKIDELSLMGAIPWGFSSRSAANLSVPNFKMNFGVAGLTKTHKIPGIVRSALRE